MKTKNFLMGGMLALLHLYLIAVYTCQFYYSYRVHKGVQHVNDLIDELSLNTPLALRFWWRIPPYDHPESGLARREPWDAFLFNFEAQKAKLVSLQERADSLTKEIEYRRIHGSYALLHVGVALLVILMIAMGIRVGEGNRVYQYHDTGIFEDKGKADTMDGEKGTMDGEEKGKADTDNTMDGEEKGKADNDANGNEEGKAKPPKPLAVEILATSRGQEFGKTFIFDCFAGKPNQMFVINITPPKIKIPHRFAHRCKNYCRIIRNCVIDYFKLKNYITKASFLVPSSWFPLLSPKGRITNLYGLTLREFYNEHTFGRCLAYVVYKDQTKFRKIMEKSEKRMIKRRNYEEMQENREAFRELRTARFISACDKFGLELAIHYKQHGKIDETVTYAKYKDGKLEHKVELLKVRNSFFIIEGGGIGEGRRNKVREEE